MNQNSSWSYKTNEQRMETTLNGLKTYYILTSRVCQGNQCQKQNYVLCFHDCRENLLVSMRCEGVFIVEMRDVDANASREILMTFYS